MRNIFDQYDGSENRLTHALGCCLDKDRRLLRRFVQWMVGRRFIPNQRLEVSVQRLPGESPIARDEEQRGIPDLWIYDGDSWALVIENKITATPSMGQLRRHLRTAERRFHRVDAAMISPAIPKRSVPWLKHRTWPEVYSWLRRQRAKSPWARCLAEYMEALESRMISDETLGDIMITEFDGIPFNNQHPYGYIEAKRTIRLAMQELQRDRKLINKLGIDPKARHRTAITGRYSTSVWDMIQLQVARGSKDFTKFPHLDIGIHVERANVVVTLPNGASSAMRKRLLGRNLDEFSRGVCEISPRIQKAIRRFHGAYPFMQVFQKHFLHQRHKGVMDANLEFDLRTIRGSKSGRVKRQAQWLRAVHDALADKHSNLQLAIGASLPYGDPKLRSREVLHVIANVWLACEPWMKLILGEKASRARR